MSCAIDDNRLKKCGIFPDLEIEDAAANGRIVGGMTALRGYFPFQVSLKTALTKR